MKRAGRRRFSTRTLSPSRRENGMRIAVIHVAQETNDFNPVLTTLRDYEAFGIFEGREIVEKLRGHRPGRRASRGGRGIRPRHRDGSDHPRPGRSPAAGSRGEAYRLLRGPHPRADCEAAGPIDGLALQLHGACAAEGIDDVEGEQVALCRAILGDRRADRARPRPPRQRDAEDGRQQHGDRRPPHAAARPVRHRQDRHRASDPDHHRRGASR